MSTMQNNSREPLRGILVFSAIETVAVIVWLVILGLGRGIPLLTQIIAGVVLFVGYVVEHVVAFNVGKDRPYLSWPRR